MKNLKLLLLFFILLTGCAVTPEGIKELILTGKGHEDGSRALPSGYLNDGPVIIKHAAEDNGWIYYPGVRSFSHGAINPDWYEYRGKMLGYSEKGKFYYYDKTSNKILSESLKGEDCDVRVMDEGVVLFKIKVPTTKIVGKNYIVYKKGRSLLGNPIFFICNERVAIKHERNDWDIDGEKVKINQHLIFSHTPHENVVRETAEGIMITTNVVTREMWEKPIRKYIGVAKKENESWTNLNKKLSIIDKEESAIPLKVFISKHFYNKAELKEFLSKNSIYERNREDSFCAPFFNTIFTNDDGSITCYMANNLEEKPRPQRKAIKWKISECPFIHAGKEFKVPSFTIVNEEMLKQRNPSGQLRYIILKDTISLGAKVIRKFSNGRYYFKDIKKLNEEVLTKGIVCSRQNFEGERHPLSLTLGKKVTLFGKYLDLTGIRYTKGHKGPDLIGSSLIGIEDRENVKLHPSQIPTPWEIDIIPKSYIKKVTASSKYSGNSIDCSIKNGVKGYKKFPLCINVKKIVENKKCEDYDPPKDVRFIGLGFPIAKNISRGEYVAGKKCYKIMGKKRDTEFYFIDNKLSSIGVFLGISGAGESGRTLLGEFDFEQYVKIQKQLKKKYGLTFDPGKIKTTMFLSDLQKLGRINTIYGNGTVVLSILRYRMQDYEPMDRLSVFYNSKSIADAVMKDLKEMKLKEDDL